MGVFDLDLNSRVLAFQLSPQLYPASLQYAYTSECYEV
jgi:hypothetical protein